MAKKRSEMTPEEFADNLTKKMNEELGNGIGEDEKVTPIDEKDEGPIISTPIEGGNET